MGNVGSSDAGASASDFDLLRSASLEDVLSLQIPECVCDFPVSFQNIDSQTAHCRARRDSSLHSRSTPLNNL